MAISRRRIPLFAALFALTLAGRPVFGGGGTEGTDSLEKDPPLEEDGGEDQQSGWNPKPKTAEGGFGTGSIHRPVERVGTGINGEVDGIRHAGVPFSSLTDGQKVESNHYRDRAMAVTRDWSFAGVPGLGNLEIQPAKMAEFAGLIGFQGEQAGPWAKDYVDRLLPSDSSPVTRRKLLSNLIEFSDRVHGGVGMGQAEGGGWEVRDNPFRGANSGQSGGYQPSRVWDYYRKTFPEEPKGYEKVGEGKTKAGDNAGAYKVYDQGIQKTGGTPELFYNRGFAAEKLGDHEAAREDAETALRMDPRNAQAKALYKLTRGKVSDVRIRDIEADSGGTNTLLASVAGAGGAGGYESSGAGGARVAGRTVEPGAVRGGDAGSAAYGGPAAASFRQSASLAADARRALKVKDHGAVVRLADQALRLNPKNAEAQHLKARAHLAQKDYWAAVDDATKGLELAPDNAELLGTRAMAYNRMGKFHSGLRDAAGAVTAKPDGVLGYLGRAFAYSGLGRRPEMTRDLQKAAQLDPRYEKMYANAVQLPEDADTLLLFDESLAGAADAPGAGGRSKGLVWLVVSLGAGLIGAGLWMRRSGTRAGTAPSRQAGGWSRAPDADGLVALDAETAPRESRGFWSRYEIVREIAAGGMGVVYEAVDQGLDRKVAVKKMHDTLRADPRERERFLAEARTVAKMKHENIVEIYAIEEDGDDAYLVFEYVAGRTLHDAIGDKGRLTMAQAVSVFQGICGALDYAHGKGIVHRDLKPANVIITEEGTIKVMDFGIARQVADAVQRVDETRTNTVIGTLPYMAPEQEEGRVSRAVDVFALGVCLYEALTGVLPYTGTAGAALLAKREGKFRLPSDEVPGIPPAVDELIRKALAPDPNDRPASPGQFLEYLEKTAAGV